MQNDAANRKRTGTVDAAEVARFEAMAEAWWDPDGPFKPLHQINPPRLSFIRDQLSRHFGRRRDEMHPFSGLRVLDIGCGGGLLSEPMARLGADVTAIDPSEKTLAIARRHAEAMGLAVDYRPQAAEELAATGQTFDVVLAMEIVEHVADVDAFLTALSTLTAPGGMLLMSTLNRTMKSFLLGVVGAEYILRWLPRGTHDWTQFITPEEISRALEATGFTTVETAGMRFDPLEWRWCLSRDLSVNYLLAAERP